MRVTEGTYQDPQHPNGSNGRGKKGERQVGQVRLLWKNLEREEKKM